MHAFQAGLSIQGQERIETLISHAFMREVVRKVDNTIIPLNDVGRGPPLYCVHPIGGGAAEFRDKARMLGPHGKFYAIQVPTDKRRAEFAGSIEEIGKFYVDELVNFQPEGGFVLGGYSTGAAIALEMSQQLIARDRKVSLLVVFDGELFNTGAEISARNPRYWFELLLNVPRWIIDEQPIRNRRKLASKAGARLQSAILGTLKKGAPAIHAVERYVNFDGFLPDHVAFIKALYDAHLGYVPRHYPGRVLVFAAKTQPLFYLQQVKAAWAKIAPSSEFVDINGTHVSIMKMPHGLPIAERLRREIGQMEELAD